MFQENRTLLIVDDEPETLKGYQEFLTSNTQLTSARKSSRTHASVQASSVKSDKSDKSDKDEYKILLASSGEEALDIFKNEQAQGKRIAAGFFDVKLEGGMDGLTTIQKVKELDPDIHCAVVTAYHDRTVDEINQLFGEEFKDHWDYLNKPFTQGEIIQKARQMVSSWNRQRQVELLHAQLVRSERLAGIGQVARGIGHEFGNILLRIIGKADLALMETDLEKVQNHLQVILKAAERAGLIVHNLQSFARTSPKPILSDFKAPIEEALVLVNHELTKNTVQVVKDFKPIPPLNIDVGAIAQVFLNLIINAVHAMPNGGTIHITLDQQLSKDKKSGVVAKVADTGSGIAPEILPKIFDFAFSTKGDRGSGLGLSISKEIIESHGGLITVQTQLGKGTEFSVWLPL